MQNDSTVRIHRLLSATTLAALAVHAVAWQLVAIELTTPLPFTGREGLFGSAMGWVLRAALLVSVFWSTWNAVLVFRHGLPSALPPPGHERTMLKRRQISWLLAAGLLLGNCQLLGVFWLVREGFTHLAPR